MILQPTEKIHVVHRRLFEKDTRKHFVGVVECCENGLVRAVGHVFVIEDAKENIFRRKEELRTRIISLNSQSVYVNVLPPEVNLDEIRYENTGHEMHITDGSDWHLDVKEFGWA